eukprot:15484518-Alexandrium_andersonii.AAC.1
MAPKPPDEALQGGTWLPFLGRRSSSSERLEQFCILGRADLRGAPEGSEGLQGVAESSGEVRRAF